jgi:hypothetical protein
VADSLSSVMLEGPHYVAQADPKLLGSSDFPALASQVAGVVGVHHCIQLCSLYLECPQVSFCTSMEQACPNHPILMLPCLSATRTVLQTGCKTCNYMLCDNLMNLYLPSTK